MQNCFSKSFLKLFAIDTRDGRGLWVWAVDIDTLESVLDTIAFGDIQGEDTRNFTEANFVKIFRLAQLMVAHHWTFHLSFVPTCWWHTTRTCCNFFLQIVQYIVSCNQVSSVLSPSTKENASTSKSSPVIYELIAVRYFFSCKPNDLRKLHAFGPVLGKCFEPRVHAGRISAPCAGAASIAQVRVTVGRGHHAAERRKTTITVYVATQCSFADPPWLEASQKGIILS